MKTSIVSTVSTLLLLASSAVFAKPASDIEATLTVTQWVNDQIISSTDKAIERFAKVYPNVTIKTQYVPVEGGGWGEYNNAFINQVAAGDAPDIIASAIEGFAEMASKDVLLDLETLSASDPAARKVLAGIEQNLLDGMRTRPGGTLNFFPTEWNNIVMYYNKDIFDEAGVDYPPADWTWDDFLETAKILTKQDDGGHTAQYGYVVPGFNFGLQPWFFTNNAGVLDESWSNPTVDTPEFREALQFLHDLIRVHKVAPSFEDGVGAEKFNAGQIAMLSAGHWVVPEIITSGLDNIGVQYMPRRERQATVFGIGGLAITKFAEHPDLAWEFIKEMTGSEYQQELADSGRSIPSAREFATTAEWTSFPEGAEIFYETAATAIAVPSPPNFSQVQEILMRYLGSYMNDEVDLDTTISGMDRDLQRAMKRANR